MFLVELALDSLCVSRRNEMKCRTVETVLINTVQVVRLIMIKHLSPMNKSLNM